MARIQAGTAQMIRKSTNSATIIDLLQYQKVLIITKMIKEYGQQ